ncbi:MAG TPA: acyl-CoA carboxylase epsilon subunit [Frankiaceae bacterium]|nr:acyl-CoA carboxylase epsilon subunit [Frankiaceae bacterium]
MRHPTTPLRGAAGTPPVEPALRVIRGDATTEEVAALVAVLAARGGDTETEPPRTSEWARPQPRRALPSPGPGAWRAAARDARTRAAW